MAKIVESWDEDPKYLKCEVPFKMLSKWSMIYLKIGVE